MPAEKTNRFIPSRLSVDSLTLRSVLVTTLALLMLIPLGFVSSIVGERGHRYNSVLYDIASTWGEAQTVIAPVLHVPFVELETIEATIIDQRGESRVTDKVVRRQRTAIFLPQSLDLKGTLADQWRERGIFRSLVYTAELSVDATFPALDLSELSDAIDVIHWDRAWLSIGLSDTRAINQINSFTWNNQQLTQQPGARQPLLQGGFHSPLPEVDATKEHAVNLSMSIRGSGQFHFVPLGEKTTVDLESAWPHPSFQGRSLPQSRTVTEQGFSAQWSIPHLARSFPQTFRSDTPHNLTEFTAGVSMFEPVSLYSLITRSAKYGILFIGLTFITLLAFEFTVRRRLHVVQYALVGFALSLFYLVLLSLAEHMAFSGAYLIAASLTISLITGYTWAVLGSFSKASAILGVLAALYAVLYSLLHLEDYALLMGTALLVVVLGMLMIATRKIHRPVSEDSEVPA